MEAFTLNTSLRDSWDQMSNKNVRLLQSQVHNTIVSNRIQLSRE